ncbi:MAG: hypothetical protein KIT63_18185 [Rhodoferax sp.]|nr:hypothetical protein [Rhodoferax sp.]
MSLSATMEQDRAAGGQDRRKLKVRSGDVVVVSLAISGTGIKTPFSVAMRFKSGGMTIARPVGKIDGESRFAVLRKGWVMVREERIAERNGWQWLAE